MNQELRQRLLRLWKRYQYFLLVLAVGVVLLAFSFPTQSKQSESKEDTDTRQTFDLDGFEQQVCESLSKISGAGRVDIMLSLESGEENVYASDVNQSSKNSGTDSSSEEYQSTMSILSDGSYGESPVLIQTNYPTFRGAVVLCDGADRDAVRLEITQAVGALCGLSSDRISILKME